MSEEMPSDLRDSVESLGELFKHCMRKLDNACITLYSVDDARRMLCSCSVVIWSSGDYHTLLNAVDVVEKFLKREEMSQLPIMTEVENDDSISQMREVLCLCSMASNQCRN